MFADIADVCVLVYLDDITIFNKITEEHKQHIYAMFKRLADNNFHVKYKKCTLLTNSNEFLGHIILHCGIEICPNKVVAIKDWPVPTPIPNVQSFWGLCNYFNCYILNFAHVARLLTNLTCIQLEFSSYPECQQAFNALKQKLLDVPVLIVFDPAVCSEVWCDASNFAVGAVLMQQNTPDSPWYPIEYLSKHLNSSEYNYSAIEHEFICLIQACVYGAIIYQIDL